MLKNFIRIAWRTLAKNKVYAIINFVGLTGGITLALLVMMYIRFETGYDQFHTKADRLYRITNTTSFGRSYALTPPAIATHIREYFPGVQEVGRMYGRSVSVRSPLSPQTFEEQQVMFADSSIFNMLDFEFVGGKPLHPLHEKFTMLVTEETATKYFGDQNPVGEVLLLGGRHSFRIVGVVKNFPSQSHLHFTMLVPYENMYDLETDENAIIVRNNLATNFITTHSYTYVLLNPEADPDQINAGMDAFIRRYAPPERQVGQKFSLMKLTDIHLHSTLAGEAEVPNSIDNLWIFGAVGLLTLLMACINYINLSTAQSLMRVKEIGMRKIFGAFRSHLIIQFFVEGMVFCASSWMLSFLGAYLALPWLNKLTGGNILFEEAVDPGLIMASVGLLLLVSVLAGGYPAWFVIRFRSVNALKGAWGHPGKQGLRQALVVFQLSIAMILLSGSMLILKQLDFLQNRRLGFNREQVLAIPLFSENMNGLYGRIDSAYYTRLDSYRATLERESGILRTSLASDMPGLGGTVYRSVVPEGFSKDERISVSTLSVDYDFIDLYGMQLVAGRAFNRDYGTDATSSFIINESALKEFKWTDAQSALGKTIYREADGKTGLVIGVVKDFNFDLLTTPVSGLMMDVNQDLYAVLTVRYEHTQTVEVIRKLEASWNSFFPEKSFQFYFLDEQLRQEYKAYENFGHVMQSFTVLALMIACLGVYGLVLFTVQRKVKEIGVRKVLGASSLSIQQLIFRNFAKLSIGAFAIATPMAYFLMDRWLSGFAYRTALGAGVFLLSLTGVLIVMMLTIILQVIKASRANPVQSLRSE
jgi:putative ABC transport system permease protein